MSNQEDDYKPDPFAPNLRQRRLRVITYIVIGIIATMLCVSVVHPFFHPTPPAMMTEKIRRAFKVQALIIWLYYSTCLLLAFLLVIIAWLYTREVRFQLINERMKMLQATTMGSGKKPENSPPEAEI
ncbi:MAG: hypothetical protein ABJA67_07250 [Chthonomonadales bacterium]